MGDEQNFVDRRKINKVCVDSLTNGAESKANWINRALWLLVITIPSSAFYVGGIVKEVDQNTSHIEILAENQSEILQTLSRIGTQVESNDDDIERLENVNED